MKWPSFCRNLLRSASEPKERIVVRVSRLPTCEFRDDARSEPCSSAANNKLQLTFRPLRRASPFGSTCDTNTTGAPLVSLPDDLRAFGPMFVDRFIATHTHRARI